MIDFATLVLAADTRQMVGARTELQGVARAGGQAEQQTNKVSQSFGGLARTAKIATAAVGALFSAGFGLARMVPVIADFESSMSKLQAVTRATSAQMREMREVAKDLGATTEFTAKQAADGLTFLGMAGFSAAESMAALPAVLDLATASGMELARSADVASNIMSAFGIEAENSAAVADLLAAASSRANTDVEQLGDAMKFVGPVAKAMGIEMSDAAAAIGSLSDAGIQGGMAGTSLRTVLSSLVNPTAGAREALSQLGLTADDVNPTMNSLTDIIHTLADSGLDAAQALQIAGQRGGPALLALTEQRVSLSRLTTELGNVEGEASRMARTMRDNLRGDMNTLASAAQGLILTLGEAGLTAILRGVFQALTTLVRGASAAVEAFSAVLTFVGRVTRGLLGMKESASDNAQGLDTLAEATTRAAQGQLDLSSELAGGIVMSREAALAKLDEASAIQTATAARIEEAQALVRASREYTRIERELNVIESNLSQMQAHIDGLDVGSPVYERVAPLLQALEEEFEALIATQDRMLASAAGVSDAFNIVTDNIAKIRDGILGADGNIVRIGASFEAARNSVTGFASGMGEVSRQTYATIPSLTELHEEFGSVGLAMREVLRTQNELARMDAANTYQNLVQAAAGLAGNLEMIGEGHEQVLADFFAINRDAPFERQAEQLAGIAKFLEDISGGLRLMDDDTRAVHDALLQAALGAAALGTEIRKGEDNTRSLTDAVAALALAFGPAIDAANTLARALSGVLAQLGGIARGLASLTRVGEAVGAATRGLPEIFGRVGTQAVEAASSAFSGAATNLSNLWQEANRAGASVDALSESLAGQFTAGGSGGSSPGGGGGAAGAAETVEEAMKRATQAIVDNGQGSIRAAEAYRDTLLPAINDVSQAFGDFIADGAKDFEGLLDGIGSAFKRTLSRMVAEAASQQIAFRMGLGPAPAAGGGLLGGLLGGGGGGGGLPGGLLGGGGGGGLLGGILGGGGAAGAAGGIGAAFTAMAGPIAIGVGLLSLFGRRKKKSVEEDKRHLDEEYRLQTRKLELQGRTRELEQRQLAQIDPRNQALAREVMNLEKRTRVDAERRDLEYQLAAVRGDERRMRRMDLELVSQSNKAAQIRIWREQDAAKIQEANKPLRIELLRLRGREADARRLEREGLHKTTRALLNRIAAEQRADERAATLAGRAATLADMDMQILRLRGNSNEIRRAELQLMEGWQRAKQRELWLLEDSLAVQAQKEGLEERLWRLQGDTASLRAREASAIDRSNMALLKQIWALEDMEESLDKVNKSMIDPRDFETIVDYNRAVALEAIGAGRSTGAAITAPNYTTPSRITSPTITAAQSPEEAVVSALGVLTDITSQLLSSIDRSGRQVANIQTDWQQNGLPDTRT